MGFAKRKKAELMPASRNEQSLPLVNSEILGANDAKQISVHPVFGFVPGG